jgi:hypothetical protein
LKGSRKAKDFATEEQKANNIGIKESLSTFKMSSGE